MASARRLAALVVVSGCFTSSPPPPPISNASPPAARASRTAEEMWTGTGYQPDAGSEWAIEMRIRRAAPVGARLGTIAYPSLGCSGELIREPDREHAMVAIEHLQVNPDGSCVDGGTIVLRDDGEELSFRWYYESGVEGATATLRRASSR